MSVEINEDNTGEFEALLRASLRRALEKVGLVAEGYAKRLCPVDTGRLRNSITHEVEGESAYIGTNVEYAPHVEMGTSRTKAQPFLRPAAQNHGAEYSAMIRDELKNA